MEQQASPAIVEEEFNIAVGSRIKLKKDENLVGTLRFFGPTEFATGLWCGVELDTTDGRNDGTVQGKKYFESAPNHGIFVRGNAILPLSQDIPVQSSNPNPSIEIASPTTPAPVVVQTPTPAPVIAEQPAPVSVIVEQPAPVPTPQPTPTPIVEPVAAPTPTPQPSQPSQSSQPSQPSQSSQPSQQTPSKTTTTTSTPQQTPVDPKTLEKRINDDVNRKLNEELEKRKRQSLNSPLAPLTPSRSSSSTSITSTSQSQTSQPQTSQTQPQPQTQATPQTQPQATPQTQTQAQATPQTQTQTQPTSSTNNSVPSTPIQEKPLSNLLTSQFLDSLEANAKQCSENLLFLTASLRSSLQAMGGVTGEYMELYKSSVDNTTSMVSVNLVEMNNLITRCQELRDDMKPVEALALQVKAIRKLLDHYELLISKLIK